MTAVAEPVALDSRARLIAAARELLWRNSYATVSVDDLCRRAAVNKGSFYHHFPSKADLATVTFDAMWSEFRPLFDSIFSAQVPPLERFASYGAVNERFQREKQQEYGCVVGCPFTNLASEVCTQDQALRELMVIKHTRMCAYFTTAIRDGQADGSIPAGDPLVLAQQIQAFVTGVATQARIVNDLTPYVGFASGIRRLLGVT